MHGTLGNGNGSKTKETLYLSTKTILHLKANISKGNPVYTVKNVCKTYTYIYYVHKLYWVIHDIVQIIYTIGVLSFLNKGVNF